MWRIVIASHGHSNEASAKPLFRGRPVFWCSQMSHDIQRWSSKLWSFKGRTSCELLRPIGICRSRDSRRIVDCLLSEVWLPPSVRTRSSPFELSRFQDSGHFCPRRSSARRNAISRCSLVGDPAFAVAPKPLQCTPPEIHSDRCLRLNCSGFTKLSGTLLFSTKGHLGRKAQS